MRLVVKRWQFLFVAAALAVAASGCAPEKWVAIACSPTTFVCGRSVPASMETARQFAMAYCKEADCEIGLTTDDSCVAIARQDSDGRPHLGIPHLESGETDGDARYRALERCQTNSGSLCEIELSSCH